MSIPLSLSGKVAFSYRNARSEAEALAKECGANVCYPIAADLNSIEAARPLVTETVRHFGRLDILVANHGVWPPEDVPIERMSDEQWRSTLAVNVDGVFGLAKYAVAQMKTQPRVSAPAGHIVLISSTS